jgi:hypothetical protein
MKMLMYMSKSYLLPFCLLFVFGLMSCEEQAINPELAPESELELEKPIQVSFDNIIYRYNGKSYTEDELFREGTDYSVVIINGAGYVFDSSEELAAFEEGEEFKQEYKNFMEPSEKPSKSSANERSVGSILYANARSRMRLYDLANYSGTVFDIYTTNRIGRKRTRIGFENIDIDYRYNVPAFMKNKATSYKIEYLSAPTIENVMYDLRHDLKVGPTSNPGPQDFRKKLSRIPSIMWVSDGDNDLSNNWIALAPGAKWNNQVESTRFYYQGVVVQF